MVVDTYKEWKIKLESSKQSELASEITKMIDKIQDMRIKTLKADIDLQERTREMQLKLTMQKNDEEIRTLEEEIEE